MSFENQLCQFWNYLYSFLNIGFIGDTLITMKSIEKDYFKYIILTIMLLFGYSMVFVGIRMKKTNLTFFFTLWVFNLYFKLSKSIKFFLRLENFLPEAFSDKIEFEFILEKFQSKKGLFLLIVLIISLFLAFFVSYLINGILFVLISSILVSLYMTELTSTKMGMLVFISICFLALLLYILVFNKIEKLIIAIVFAIGGTFIIFNGTSHIIRNFFLKKKNSEDIFDHLSKIPIHLKISILSMAMISFLFQSIYIFQNKEKR